MTLAIMQPYFFPYIGYWQLLHAADTFVIYDDVNYIKQGYINRNSILAGGKEQRITLEVIGASSNKNINQIQVGNNAKKLLKTIEQAYRKAPMYDDVFPVLSNILTNPEKKLAVYLGDAIKAIAEYLGLDITIRYSSDIEKDNSLAAQKKVIEICRNLGAKHYINSIGGKELYDKQAFEAEGITLSFLKPELMEYQQFGHEFVPFMSIIDVIMFNSKVEVQKMIGRYVLV